MSFATSHYLIFSLSFFVAMVMIVEGGYIVLSKKLITPLPAWILYGLGALVVGNQKSSQRFLGKTTLKDLRTYAFLVLIFGTIILISSFVYLFTPVR